MFVLPARRRRNSQPGRLHYDVHGSVAVGAKPHLEEEVWVCVPTSSKEELARQSVNTSANSREKRIILSPLFFGTPPAKA